MPDKSLWRDAFNFHAECLDRLDEINFWDLVFYPKFEALSKKHQGNEFFADMMAAVFGEIERRWKRGSVQLASGQE